MKTTILALTAFILANAPLARAQEETPRPAPTSEATAPEKSESPATDTSVSVTTEKSASPAPKKSSSPRTGKSFFACEDHRCVEKNYAPSRGYAD